MIRLLVTLSIVLGSLNWSLSAHAADAKPARPNIVIILADDVGYHDLSCYGATKTQTPHLDRLAKAGTRFLDAHSPSSVCTPTRYAFLTGQYAWRHAPGSGIMSGVTPLCIPTSRATIASTLKQAGYKTGVVGKWHLGFGAEGDTNYNAPLKPGPLEIGFDYAFLMPATGDRVPTVYVKNHEVVGLDANDPLQLNYKAKIGTEPTGKENPDLLTNQRPSAGHDNTIVNGISRIGWMAGGQAARWVDEDIADTFAKEAVAFIEREQAEPFFLFFSTHDIHVPRAPHKRFQGTSAGAKRGDAVHQLDFQVGAVLDALDRLKLTDNTLVIFTSDNGGVIDDGYQDGAAMAYKDESPNSPLRGFKGQLYEGGHRVPFLARWPGHVKAGATSSELFCHLDLFATTVAITGAKLAEGAAPDSVNLLGALTSTGKGREHLIHHTNGPNGALAIRKGPWKLIGGMPNPKAPDKAAPKKKAGGAYAPAEPGALFNLNDDLQEQKNVAVENPEVVKELRDLLERERK
ncbi:MAG TPA: arylsulfatase [Pirellulaceae bacterium]|nr:arylsulfatase [Pirellulaceae bacterium]